MAIIALFRRPGISEPLFARSLIDQQPDLLVFGGGTLPRGELYWKFVRVVKFPFARFSPTLRFPGRFREMTESEETRGLGEEGFQSVFRWPVSAVDDNDLHRPFLRFQVQAQLLFQRRKDAGT